ncbi:hypothetical protein TrVE_jg10775 [Triparma verrucosa]|uniref:Aldehyde dehydrogenase domain-containing protein n=1 Tax=Triparma verrucosa TaxID=1606542 RepID=A0A9W7EXD5_9STRA|nr:hypothetical protein TrVE_jg10775 [Triparma verrucosa]
MGFFSSQAAAPVDLTCSNSQTLLMSLTCLYNILYNGIIDNIIDFNSTKMDSLYASIYASIHNIFSTLFGPLLPRIICLTFLYLTCLYTFKLTRYSLQTLFPAVIEWGFTKIPTIHVALLDKEEKEEYECKDTRLVVQNKDLNLKNPSRKNYIQCYDPSTGVHLGEVPAMTEAEVFSRVSLAKSAQLKWSKTSFKERRLVLRTIQKYILSHIEDICRVSSRDSGKPKVDALLGEVMTTCEKIRCINVNGESWLSKSYRPTGPLMLHKTAYVEYVPYGVLGVIAPWNYPFHNMLNHVISGLYSGNAVVSKVSEHTSWSSRYFTGIVREALRACGHDPDVVQTITGFAEAGEAVVKCPGVDKIIFTGSPGVGRMVMKGASEFLKPVILELGGKDPMVFCDDVCLDEVMSWSMRGCFQNCGQNCCGVERIFAYEKIHDEFLRRAEEKIRALRQGVPLACCGHDGEVDCGAMVMEGQINIIQALIDDAVKKGATLHCGGKRNTTAGNGYGQFYEPTLISGITSDMRIAKEEVFGPVMCVVKVPNNDDDECIRMINDCDFGLGSSVYSRDAARAKRMGEQIKSGMFTANDFGVNYLVQSLPFGGVKDSGFDRFAGPEGLRACCLERSIVLDRIPFVKTTIPDPINYPIKTSQGMQFSGSLINLMYNESLFGKLKAIFGIIKAS